jgi:hypothetical protein
MRCSIIYIEIHVMGKKLINIVTTLSNRVKPVISDNLERRHPEVYKPIQDGY